MIGELKELSCMFIFSAVCSVSFLCRMPFQASYLYTQPAADQPAHALAMKRCRDAWYFLYSIRHPAVIQLMDG